MRRNPTPSNNTEYLTPVSALLSTLLIISTQRVCVSSPRIHLIFELCSRLQATHNHAQRKYLSIFAQGFPLPMSNMSLGARARRIVMSGVNHLSTPNLSILCHRRPVHMCVHMHADTHTHTHTHNRRGVLELAVDVPDRWPTTMSTM